GAFPHGCPVGAAALVLPGRAPLALGPVAEAGDTVSLGRLAYPANGSIVAASALAIAGRSCSKHATPARAELRSVRLFGRALSASRVSLALGSSGAANIGGLAVHGSQAALVNGKRMPLGSWGYVVGGTRPVTTSLDGRRVVSALAIHLTRAHAGLPAQATVLVLPAVLLPSPVAAVPRPTKHPRIDLRPHRYRPA